VNEVLKFEAWYRYLNWELQQISFDLYW